MSIEPDYLDQGAIFGDEQGEPTLREAGSPYRYRLWRLWDETKPRVAFGMLNPSTADHRKLDPTLRRCLGFAMRWGYGCFEVVNMYGLRATDPAELLRHPAPVGRENDVFLRRVAGEVQLFVCGWGAHPKVREREAQVLELLRDRPLHALKLTAGGRPSHPLYLKSDLEPQPFGRCA